MHPTFRSSFLAGCPLSFFLTAQIESFCNQQMESYDPLFPQGSTQAGLDQIDRRFAWFRRLLRGVDLRFDGVFPKHWRLQHRLCMRFLAQTRTALAEILEGGSKEAEDVTVLLKVGSPLGTSWLLVVAHKGFWPRRTLSLMLSVGNDCACSHPLLAMHVYLPVSP